MNQIFFRDFLFDDRIIRNARITLENSMVAESLAPDGFIFTIEFNPDIPSPVPLKSNEGDFLESNEGDQLYSLGDISTLGDLIPYSYGEEVTVYHNDQLLGKFFVQSIKQKTEFSFEFTCTSIVGMLSTVTHYGGIYTDQDQTTFKDLVDDIFNTAQISSATYTIDNELKTLPIRNWLPIASCRDNLLQACFPLGISILKDADGSLHFTYNNGVAVAAIPSSRIYMDGRSLDYETPATKVTVIEHAFYKSSVDQTVELYNDNTAVVSKLVTFEKPCYDLNATGGLTIDVVGGIEQSGANYAIVSGAGTLTGKEYTHTTKEISMFTGATGEPNEKTVSDAYLVDASNSYYTTLRVARYYGHCDEDSYAMTLVDTERNYTGQLVSFKDVTGKQKTGYIRTLDINLSETVKANARIASGFALGPFGSNFVDSLILWSGDGEGEMDANMVSLNGRVGSFDPSDYGLDGEHVRLVVFSSSPGGQGGTNGSPGTTGTFRDMPTAGAGGDAGAGNIGLWYKEIDIDLTEASYSVTLGEGGAAGVVGGGAGGDLNHSSFGTHSSSQGIEAESGGYYNIITLHTYGGKGDDGIRGGDGGGGLGWDGTHDSYAESADGESVYFMNGNTPASVNGGHHGASYSWMNWYTSGHYRASAVGGGGGGAAVGNPGGDGTDSTAADALGTGGNGANVHSSYYPKQAVLGRGGAGGHGGGGGGIAGNYEYETVSDNYYAAGAPGAGGNGSPGGKGADGFILILSPKTITGV